MWPFARKVRCVDCGFLKGYARDPDDPDGSPIDVDLSLDHRLLTGRGRLPDFLSHFHCYRRAGPHGRMLGHDVEQMLGKRRCAYFYRFVPGFDADAHLDLHQRANEARRNRKQQTFLVLISATVGALLGRIDQILRAFGVIP
jgi:hypothetical protein